MRNTRTYSHLITKLAAAMVVFAVANVIVYSHSEYFEREQEYRAEVEAVLDRPDVHALFAGDSHVASLLNDYLNTQPAHGAYSLAFGGDSLREVYAKLRYVLDRKSHIDTLFITADPHMFGKGRLESSNRTFADAYFLLAGDSSGLKRGWASTVMNQVPLFNDDFVQFLRKSLSVSLGKGRKPVADSHDVAWGDLSESERVTQAGDTGAGDHAGVGEHREPFDWYARILHLARERNIRVIGIRFPAHSAYSAQVPPGQLTKIDDFLHRNGITAVTDLRDAFTDPHSFQDSDHLSRREAAAFMKVLRERLGESL